MTTPDFDRLAERYEELRPLDQNWWEVFYAIVRLGQVRARRVIEVGCGTGRVAQALAERELAGVWALDVSPAMVEKAKSLGVNARVARAERLPFKAGWFDAVIARMVIHLVDRKRAFAEAERVLNPGGRFVIATEDPASFDDVWFAKYFPSVPELERTRFPDGEALTAELTEAGLSTVRIEELRQERTITREQALDLIRSKAFSTFELLPDEEYEAGLEQAEAELPERLSYRFDWLLVVATR